MFDFIKKKLQRIYHSITSNLVTLFGTQKISADSLRQLEKILLTADTGVATTKKIIASLEQQYTSGKIAQGVDLQKALAEELLATLEKVQIRHDHKASIFLLIGINGSGKTTFAGKLAYSYIQQSKRCMLAAADTFRAAAPEQLKTWANDSGAELFVGGHHQDPAAVAFGACEKFKQGQADILIIDTAGRLQTKEHLMREIAKLKKVIEKQLPGKHIHTLLSVDAMLGQNSFDQAQIFHEAVRIDGIVLTKMDGTGKGGIIFSIADRLGIPIEYISYGEHIDDLKKFDPRSYVRNLVGSLQDTENDTQDY